MPNTVPTLQIFLPSQQSTTLLGEWIAPRLVAGDVILLSGSIGAGKTHLARSIIQTRLGRNEDVPSPTFTLIQTYDAAGVEIWHADLYRLSHPDEVFELGLEEAFKTAICLIEWPERMGKFLPPKAIAITMLHADEGRRVTISAPNHPQFIAALNQEWGGTFV